MALELIVDALDKIPESLRSEYVEKDGKFHLSVNGLEDTGGLKSALKSERDRAAALEKQTKAWAKLGKSPDEIGEMVEAARIKEEQAALKAGKFDEVLGKKLGEAKQERDNAVGTAEKQRDSALNIARQAVIGTSLATALTKSKATVEGLDLLSERLSRRVKIEFDDAGSASSSIVEADGKTPMVGNGPGGLATYDDLVKEAMKQYPSLFEATGAGGGGKSPKEGPGGSGDKVKTIPRDEWDKLSPFDQAAKIKLGFKPVD
jgi:hypothetical protein